MKLEDLVDRKTLQTMRQIQDRIETLRMAVHPVRELRDQALSLAGVSRFAFENYQSSMLQFTEAWRRDIQPAVEAVSKLRHELSPLNETIRQFKIQAQPYSEAFRQIRELSERISIELQPLTFGEVYEQLVDRYSTLSEEGVTSPIEVLSEEIEEKVNTSTPHPLAVEFYLNFVIALFLFVLSQTYSIESEEKILSSINEIQTIVTKNNAKIRSLEYGETFYIVIRAVNLREGPNTKSQILSILHPNTKVRLLERKSKWIKIEYFDYLSETTREGWAYKKYLKILNKGAIVYR